MDLNYVVKDETNIRQVLKEHFGISNRLLLKLKQNKKIYLNGSNDIYLDFPVKENDLIEVDLNFEEDNSNIVPAKMDLKILYEDDSLIIIDKPPHMPVHPSLNHYENSLSNGLKYYYDSINLHRLIRPINRLDKDTSGIVMFAKNEYIQSNMQNRLHNQCSNISGIYRHGINVKTYAQIIGGNARTGRESGHFVSIFHTTVPPPGLGDHC